MEGSSSDLDESIENGKDSLAASNLMEGSSTWYVGQNITSGGNGSEENPFNNLKLALNKAKENDTIKVNEGIYSGTNNTGLSIGIKGLTIESNGGNVVFDGGNSRNAFSISSANVCINGLDFVNTKYSGNGGSIYSSGANTTITNCNFINTSSTSYGGAVYISGSNAKIENSTFNNTKTTSSTSSGGALYISGANSSVENSVFNNCSSATGGALYISGANVNVIGSTFNGTKSNSRNGGAVYINGVNATVKSSNFTNSISSSSAGAVYITGVKATVEECSFTNTSSGLSYAGAIYFDSKNASVINCNFTNTNGSNAGSVYFGDYYSTLTGSNFNNTRATGYGGAVYFAYGDNTVEDCSFTNTSAKTQGGSIYFSGANNHVVDSTFNRTDSSFGGTIFFSGKNSTVAGSSFTNTNATNGGSIYFNGANCSVTGSEFDNTLANTYGGAIYSTSANITVADSSFDNYVAAYGGALHLSGANATVENSTFNNGQAFKGGSIYLTGANGAIRNSEFSDNTADYGGTIFNGGSNLDLVNNAIESSAANVAGNCIYNNGTVTNAIVIVLNNSTQVAEPHHAVNAKVEVTDDMGNPIYGGNVTVYKDGTKLGIVNVTDNSTIRVYPLKVEEVLLSGGNYSRGNCTNKTGVISFEVESLGPYYVSMDGSDDNDGSIDHPVRNIETAIYLASRDNVTHAIFINEGTYNESVLYVNKSMNITGLGDVVINSSSTNKSIMSVSGSYVNITNIDFANGNSTNGGALYITGTYAKLDNCGFYNNTATNGGAIYNTGNRANISNCDFDNNSASNGGSIYNTASYVSLSNNTMTRSEAPIGQYIYTTSNFNRFNATVLNNSTVICPEGKNVNVTVEVYDDMGHPIHGGKISILLNSVSIASGVKVIEGNASALVNPTQSGDNLATVTGSVVSVKTGVIQFEGTPYTGPSYVSEDGSDDNDGSIDHPLKTISSATQLASNSNAEHSVYINEGHYDESNITVNSPLNITGLGDVTIDGNNENTSIMNVSSSNVNISNIKFENGNASNGGAINWAGNNGHLDNCTFTDNNASNGGAVYVSGQGNVISNSTFTDNNATHGGAVYLSGSKNNITDSEFSNNDADIGGSIYVSGERCCVDNISASDDHADHFGGSVAWYGNSGVLNNSNINNSTAEHMGGGVYWHTVNNGTIDNSTFHDNYAIAGGAVYWAGNGGKINNTDLSKNSAEYGGAIYWLAGNGTVSDSNVTKNNAYSDIGGIASNETLKLENVILGENTPQDILNITNETMFVHTTNNGYNNVLLTNGYRGYCINHHRGVPGDSNTMMVTDMSIVINNLDGSNVADYLKIMFYNYENLADQNLIWIFTDGDYRNSDNPTVQKILEDYDNGLRIPNHGAIKQISPTKIKTYDFTGLMASYNRGQNLFGYKIKTEEIVYNMTLEKESLNKTIYNEGQTEFLLVVRNTGNNYLSDVFICEDEYEGLIYDSYVDEDNNWTHSIVDGKHHWTFNGDLAPGENATLLVIFNATKPGNFTNYAVAGSNETDNHTANNTTKVYEAKIKVEKITLTPEVPVGRQTSFIIRVTNIGDCDLDNVTVEERSYEGLIFDSFKDSTGKWIFDESSMKWDYNATLGIGDSAEFTVVFNSTEPGNFTNIVYAGNNLTNDTTNNTTSVYDASIKVEKITLTPEVPVGRQTSFIIRVTNDGNHALDNVTVKEVSYEGLVYDSYVDDSGKWSFNKTSMTWSYDGSLDIEESAEFTVFFNSTEPGNFTNIAYAGNHLTNDTANNTTEVHEAKLKVEKITLTPKVPVGRQTSFLIRVTNIGDWDLENVYVKELKYDGLTYDHFTDESNNWEFNGKNKWTYKPVLKIGESAEFTVFFNTLKAGNFTNIVIAGNDVTNDSCNNTTEVYVKENNDTNNTNKNSTKKSDNKSNNNTNNSSNFSNVIKKETSVHAGISAGNPLFVLFLAFVALVVPLRYRKDK